MAITTTEACTKLQNALTRCAARAGITADIKVKWDATDATWGWQCGNRKSAYLLMNARGGR